MDARARALAALRAGIAAPDEASKLQAALHGAVSATLEAMGLDAGGAFLTTAGALTTVPVAVVTPSDGEIAALDHWQRLCQHVLVTGEAIHASDRAQLVGLGVLQAGDSPHYQCFYGVPISLGATTLGVLFALGCQAHAFSATDERLFRALARQLALAVETTGLADTARRAAIRNERQRLSRELHDSVSQLLYSLTLLAEAGRRMVESADLPAVAHNQARIAQISQQALHEIRLIVYELRLSDQPAASLADALRERLEAVERRSGIEAQLVIKGEPVLDAPVRAEVLPIVNEALNNALKHAEATYVTVTLSQQDGRFMAEVSDNGRGFDLDEGWHSGGMGLKSMSERAARLGGALTITSQPGKGAVVRMWLGVPQATAILTTLNVDQAKDANDR